MALTRTPRSRRWVTVLVAVVVLAAASAEALWVTRTWLLTGDTRALAAHDPASSRVSAPAVPSTCRSPLTSDAPLRLWIGGDSLAGSLGPALGTTAGNTGIVQPVFDSRVSSGLTTPGFFDWPRHATQEMARLDPEVVVFIIDTNDTDLVRAAGITNGVPDWQTRWEELVSQMLDILGGPDAHRYVYWVGGPTIRDATIDAGVRQLNDVARTVVAGHLHASFVDAYQVFSDSLGRFSFTLPDPTGKDVVVRTNDGIHFTPAGANRLGQTIFMPLDARCGLDRQAVPGSPKAVIETPGSTQVGSSATPPTTAGATAPVTAPPPPPPPPSTTTPPTVTVPLPPAAHT